MGLFFPQREDEIVALDRKMRCKLASSLEHISDKAASTLDIENSELEPLLCGDQGASAGAIGIR